MYEWVVVEYWSVVTVHKVFSFHDLSCLLKKSYGAIILFSFKFNIFMFCVPALFSASTLSLLNLPYVNNASLNFSRLLCLRLVFTSDRVRVGVGVVIRSIELMIEWKQRSDSTYDSVTYVPLMTQWKPDCQSREQKQKNQTNHKAWERALWLVYPSTSASDSDNLVFTRS